MYNEKVKELFTEEYVAQRPTITRNMVWILFDKTAKYEEFLEKDCSEFNADEIRIMYKDWKSVSAVYLLQQNTGLKAYTTYVLATTNAKHPNAYEKFVRVDVEMCTSKQQLLTRNQLSDLEDQLYNYTDKAVLECLWEGITGPRLTDLTSLERGMLSKNNKMLRVNDKVYFMTERLYHFLDEAFRETEYQCLSKRGGSVIVALENADKLYKKRKNAKPENSKNSKYAWARNKLLKISDYYDIPDLTANRIKDSGLFFNLQLGMVSAGETNLRAFLVTKEGRDIAKRYGYDTETYIDTVSFKFRDFT